MKSSPATPGFFMLFKYNKDMELRVLRYFLAVIQEENISRAAQALHITQPTLSRQLHELEEELGVPLFIRGSRRISLTEQGALFSQRARQIVELADKAQAEMAGEEDGLSGTIVIGLPAGCALASLSDAIVQFRENCPRVRFRLLDQTRAQRLENMELGLLDLAVFIAPVDLDGCPAIPFMQQESIYAAFQKDHPFGRKLYVTAEDLKHTSLIFPEDGLLKERLHAFAPSCKPDFTVNAISAGLALANAGAGIYFCPETAPTEQVESRPLEPPIHLEYSLVFKDRTRLSPAAGAFLRFLEQKNDL